MSRMAEVSNSPGKVEGGMVFRRLLQIIFVTFLWAAVLLLSAGKFDWADAWIYLAVYVGILAVNAVAILTKAPDLAAERSRIRKDAKSWDKWLSTGMALIGPLLFLATAGLDERFGWSPEIGLPVKVAALLLFAAGYGFAGWAMISNRFFSGMVAIQRDRGHTVVSSGPYRFMRHPGYVGMGIAYLVTPIALGSLWAMVPALLTIGVLVLRTAMEDKTLQEELPGYRDYAGKVRYRLFPGVW